jgi:hypothetical protein
MNAIRKNNYRVTKKYRCHTFESYDSTPITLNMDSNTSASDFSADEPIVNVVVIIYCIARILLVSTNNKCYYYGIVDIMLS